MYSKIQKKYVKYKIDKIGTTKDDKSTVKISEIWSRKVYDILLLYVQKPY